MSPRLECPVLVASSQGNHQLLHSPEVEAKMIMRVLRTNDDDDDHDDDKD